MSAQLIKNLQDQLSSIHDAGTFKAERVISTSQGAKIQVKDQPPVLNMCANNYLGLSAHPDVIRAAHDALDRWGYGLSRDRFICGTKSIHTELEEAISGFLGTEDCILYTSCFDANGGLFETLLDDQDAIISDSLNHASIIDGVRLCKAQRFRFANNDMEDLEKCLQEAQSARHRLIATDGVFSMDGYIANLPAICELADKYDALIMVDDSHAVGFIGQTGRGTHEYHDCMDRIDIITGTLGKALGGASGGYTAGRKEIIDLLRQRSRPYLFSNSVAPSIVGASLMAIELLTSSTTLRDTLETNTTYFRSRMESEGFEILPGTHPIVPIMLGDASLATRFADRMLELGVYVIGFSYPVVPQGQARIRTQISAAHSIEDLDFAIEQFNKVKAELL